MQSQPSLPPPRTPPLDAARCAFTCGGKEKGHDDALPSIEGRRDGIPGQWRTFCTGPALDRIRRQKKKTNDRTNEGPRKQRGAFDFRTRGVSIYFSQLRLFRVNFQSVFATLNLKWTHAHCKICLPKPPCGRSPCFWY